LRLAMERYGSNITVHGTADFKAQIVEVAATANLQLTFADSTLERKRVALVNYSTLTLQESNNDATDRGRRTGSGAGGIAHPAEMPMPDMIMDVEPSGSDLP